MTNKEALKYFREFILPFIPTNTADMLMRLPGAKHGIIIQMLYVQMARSL